MSGKQQPLMLAPQYQLEGWQQHAIEAWRSHEHPAYGSRHGILDLFTGAGKTVVAMGAMADAAREVPDLRFAIVVPTSALADQWVTALGNMLGVFADEIGQRRTGHQASFGEKRFIVYVINSARKLLADDANGHEVMLVVDECHVAGAEQNQRIFDAKTRFRLGLSATAKRDDLVDADGRPLPVELQPHGRELGGICFSLGLKDARAMGLLPRYEIHHHRIRLSPAECAEYRKRTKAYTNACEVMSRAGGSPGKYLVYLRGGGGGASSAQREAALAIQAALFARKQWLYQASERSRVARRILVSVTQGAEADGREVRAMVFNERIGADAEEPQAPGVGEPGAARDGGAVQLYEKLREDARCGDLRVGGAEAVAIEHSQLRPQERREALERFRIGDVRVLVSVKALVEGVDVPDADLGLSVASSASARQRIQTMGRVLRAARSSDGRRLPAHEAAMRPPKQLHLIYVGDTTDTQIYAQRDWADETGDAENIWWHWGYEAEDKVPDPDAPKPPPGEVEAWEQIADLPMPQPWPGVPDGLDWTYRGDQITTLSSDPVTAPAEAVELLTTGAASHAGVNSKGRFKTTPQLDVILRWVVDTYRDTRGFYAFGRLTTPLTTMEAMLDSRPETQGVLPSSDVAVEFPSSATVGEVADPETAADEKIPAHDIVEQEPSECSVGGDSVSGNEWYACAYRGVEAAIAGNASVLRRCQSELAPRKRGAQALEWLEALETGNAARLSRNVSRGSTGAELVEAGIRSYLEDDSAALERVVRLLDDLAERGEKRRLRALAELVRSLHLSAQRRGRGHASAAAVRADSSRESARPDSHEPPDVEVGRAYADIERITRPPAGPGVGASGRIPAAISISLIDRAISFVARLLGVDQTGR